MRGIIDYSMLPQNAGPLFSCRSSGQPHRLPCFSCVNPTVPPMSPPAPQANPTMPPFLLLPLTCTEPCTAVLSCVGTKQMPPRGPASTLTYRLTMPCGTIFSSTDWPGAAAAAAPSSTDFRGRPRLVGWPSWPGSAAGFLALTAGLAA